MSPNGGLKAAPPPPQKQNSEHTGGELNGLVVYGDVRIGLTLYSSSCSTRYELNLLLGSRKKKMSVGKKNPQKKMFRKDTTSRGHQRELARKGRHRSQLRVPTCGGMSTDGPQPTQEDVRGTKKKTPKKRKPVACFFVPCFLGFFLEAPWYN